MRWMIAIAALLLGWPHVAEAADRYVLGPEDVIDVTVYGHEELTREVVVLNDGQFDYPIVGRVTATGKTTGDVASAIAKGLDKELIAPNVSVSVKTPAMRRVYASGLVTKAGSYDLKPGWRVSHLIAEAGGLDAKPDLVKATVTRGDEVLQVDLAAVLNASNREADIVLKAGDLLQIEPDTNLIHVVGQAKTPGDYQLKTKLGVLEALALAGGAGDKAALTRAQILRGTQVVPVDLYAMLTDGKTEGNVEMQPGDTLVIPANEARIAVLGGVQQPGYYDLPDGKGTTLADALGLAKGANKRAHLDNVALVRTVAGKQVVSKVDLHRFLAKGDLSQNPTVSAGDVVYVTDGSSIEPSSILSAITSLASPLLYTFIKP
jgi:polysaccharide export outer membrane protein